MSKTNKQTLLLAAFVSFGFAANAQDAGFAQLTFGSIDLSNGYSDREYVGLNSRFVLSSSTALLFDLTVQDREENVTSVAVGADFTIGSGKLRAIYETSNSNLGTAPDRKFTLGYRYDAGPATGMIYDVEVSRAEYAGNISSNTLRGELVKYFQPGAGGSFLIGQLRGAVTESSGNADLGYDVAAVATVVTPGGLNIGAEIGFGQIAYDLAPLAPVNNDYTAFKPFVSYRVTDSTEVILRGEFVDADLYELKGASIGIRIGL
ncbi:MAG: hypothetical protein MUE83_01200 [Tabrizicola sp.]|jgi:hypothetical protein|nr:hypothetical protein [Tabrizicola sp.]